MDARVSHDWRRRAHRLSRVCAPRSRWRALRRAGPRDRATSQDVDRHHRRRRAHRGELCARRHARLGRGVVHRASVAGRSIRVRGKAARVRSRARHEGVGEARVEREGRDSAMGGESDAVVGRARRDAARAARRSIGRRVSRCRRWRRCGRCSRCSANGRRSRSRTSYSSSA